MTARERECLRAFWLWGTTQDVATQLKRSVSTIEKQLHSARRALGVNRTVTAARLVAEEEGLGGYGQLASSPSVIDSLPTVAPIDEQAERDCDAGQVRNATSVSPWPAADPSGDIVGRPIPRIALTPRERLSTIGQRAVGTATLLALLLLVAVVLQRLATGERPSTQAAAERLGVDHE